MNLLIRGGVLVDTDPAPYVIGPGDLLIEDGTIAAVGTGVPVPEGTEVIDATGALVLPGFVDTHRHTWQAAIRAVAPDTTFPGYLERVLGTLAPRFRAEDVYAGDLAGALECLNAGITTLVDWSHIQLTPAHTDATVEALRRSGIRAVLGYCYGGPDGPGGLASEGRRVRHAHFDGSDPLLTMAVAALGPEIAGEDLARHEWRLARDLDLPVTVHMGGHGAESAERGLAFLRDNDLFAPGTTYIHPNFYTEESLKRIAGSGGTASVSPLVEAELGIGHPATGRARAAGIPTGLSADAVTSAPGDMFSLMRAAYTLERARGGAFTTRDALRMATAEGAEVAGLGEVTGSLRAGKQADVILLRTDTLAMAPAHDPIGAIVLSADTSCVDTVLVGGRVVKRDGRLVHDDVGTVLAALRESAAYVTA
ncbi:amidohydrolase family protein [Actinomadura sp. DC4]|uniref:amidohydrolase family protein n=1 Tax=Actinomadura sp. DC4 TaxID=3055069 RepID=UPI0025B08C8B|nr:amidohydrolase family protein [Actinomadura sp. DC4]MDN3358234.1 amidohydrolase family protein [Actinomadura sp. DC4]